ncbi:hypothetical protein BLOT_001292 [Blomia tropicalis]|nr:hypothetical protein BLOT_001292 [Blomia tropicalis]
MSYGYYERNRSAAVFCYCNKNQIFAEFHFQPNPPHPNDHHFNSHMKAKRQNLIVKPLMSNFISILLVISRPPPRTTIATIIHSSGFRSFPLYY